MGPQISYNRYLLSIFLTTEYEFSVYEIESCWWILSGKVAWSNWALEKLTWNNKERLKDKQPGDCYNKEPEESWGRWADHFYWCIYEMDGDVFWTVLQEKSNYMSTNGGWYQLNQRDVLLSWPPEPMNVTCFGSRVSGCQLN